METIELLCKQMAKDQDVLTFSDLAKAAAAGALAGEKTKVPGGGITGAYLAVSLEAADRVVRISKKLKPRLAFKAD